MKDEVSTADIIVSIKNSDMKGTYITPPPIPATVLIIPKRSPHDKHVIMIITVISMLIIIKHLIITFLKMNKLHSLSIVF